MSGNKITVHNCIKCDQNEVYWNVKNSAWYCSTCVFYRGEKLEMVKPIIMNNIPPELADKYFDLVPDLENYKELQEQCAQIAVDFSDKQNLSLKTEVNFCDEEINILKQQRDELLEALQESQLQLEYLSKKFGETGSGNSIISRNNVIIKTHEDGKD